MDRAAAPAAVRVPTTPVVVSSADLAVGTVLRADQMRVVSWPDRVASRRCVCPHLGSHRPALGWPRSLRRGGDRTRLAGPHLASGLPNGFIATPAPLSPAQQRLCTQEIELDLIAPAADSATVQRAGPRRRRSGPGSGRAPTRRWAESDGVHNHHRRGSAGRRGAHSDGNVRAPRCARAGPAVGHRSGEFSLVMRRGSRLYHSPSRSCSSGSSPQPTDRSSVVMSGRTGASEDEDGSRTDRHPFGQNPRP